MLKILALAWARFAYSTEDIICDTGDLLTYAIHDIESESIQLLINQSIVSLDTNHYFLIPKMLNSEAIQLFLSDLTSNETNVSYSTNIYKTVWQDSGDYDRYPSSNHSRNHLLWSSQAFIGRSDI